MVIIQASFEAEVPPIRREIHTNADSLKLWFKGAINNNETVKKPCISALVLLARRVLRYHHRQTSSLCNQRVRETTQATDRPGEARLRWERSTSMGSRYGSWMRWWTHTEKMQAPPPPIQKNPR